MESSKSLPDQPWEVSIWYDHGSYAYIKSPWRALDLKRVPTGPTVLYDERENKAYRYTFEGNLPTPFPDNGKTYKGRKVPFTVRYRIGPNSDWQWVSQNMGFQDGEVILQPPVDNDFLGASPAELKEGWYARKLTSEAPGAKLYSIESSTAVPTPEEGDAKEEYLTLGYIASACRWFALVRIWEPWLAPRHGAGRLHLAEPAILLAFMRTDGQHVLVLAPNGYDDCITTFKSDDSGNIVVCCRNDTGKHRKFKVLSAMAWSLEVANAALMYELRKQVVQSKAYQEANQSLHDAVMTSANDKELVIKNDLRDPSNDDSPTPQWLNSWYDSLAYCTWNSLGQDLNAEKIMNGLQSLADNKINIATLIIDDNWQSLTGEQGKTSQFDRGWTDFEAHKTGFPEGLKAAVDKIRSAHPRIRDIAVWHALLGYWGCVSNDTGHIHKDYKLRKVKINSSVVHGERYVVDPSDIHRMYDDFYTFLSNAGITAVKTDAQFFLDLLASTTDRREMTNAYQSAWTQAHLRHLSGKAISCMSQIPQILCHSLLPTNTPRVLFRTSDDFFPDVPTSHPWHVFANAHTALFAQHLNVLPDWDMFQTSHPYSGFHAAARCVSGGPIYITDTPGEHDINLIHQMTALNTQGNTIILRPSNAGKTLGTYNGYEEGIVLKIGVYDGRAEVGTGIMGVFNTAEHEISFVLPIDKIPGVTPREDNGPQDTPPRKWIVRSHQSRIMTGPIAPSKPPRGDSLLEATLPTRGYDIWSALPIQGPQKLKEKNVEIAVAGLIGKMVGACAILSSRFEPTEDGSRLRVFVQLKALGILGVWVSDASERKVEDLMIMIQGKAIPQGTVKISTNGIHSNEGWEGAKPGLIEIDIQAAWEEMGLDAGYGNEVGVEMFLS